MKLKLTLLALAISAGAMSNIAIAESTKTVDDVLAQARKTHQPVLLDFSAPWCYSCYFMMTHVLNGPEWHKLESRTVESKQRRTLPVEELAAETAIDIINECGELHAGDTITVVAAD